MRSVGVWGLAAAFGAGVWYLARNFGMPPTPFDSMLAQLDRAWVEIGVGVVAGLMMAGLGRVTGAMGR